MSAAQPRPRATRLSIRGLSMSLPGAQDAARRHAIRDLSLDIPRGQTVALVGESGCGKSLTALALMRLLPEAGRIEAGAVCLCEADGTELDLLDLPESAMCAVRGGRIGMIFQEPATCLNPVLTVGAQLREAIKAHTPLRGTAARQRALAWLQRVDLPASALDDYPFRLSGGQQQRVMIAMALAAEPDFLIADEPTTALDMTTQQQVLDLLQQLQRELGLGLLLISHDLALVAQRAQQVALMVAGQIVEVAPAAEFFSAPRHPQAWQLLQVWSSTARTDPRSTAVPPAAPLLTVRDLRVEFPQRSGWLRRLSGIPAEHHAAVDGVSFQVAAGRTLALVGESGSGKTTTGRALLQLLQGTACVSGQADWAGQNLLTLQGAALRQVRRQVQMVFQDPQASLDPRQLVADALQEGLIALRPELNAAARQAAARHWLDRVGLPAAALARYPHELSGGQRQRIAIARALAVQPRLLVCDEPTSALDVAAQAQILSLLAELQRETGVAMLFISHHLGMVEVVADDVAVMRAGHIVEAGPVAQVLQRPAHPYTQQLLAAVPRLGGTA